MSGDSGRADGTLVNAISESGEHSRLVLCVEPVMAVSLASCKIELPLVGQLGTDIELKPDSVEGQVGARVISNVEPSVVDVRDIEVHEPKKATEKKSKKQKSSKSQSSGQTKGLLKNATLQQSKNSKFEKPNYIETNLKEVNRDEEDYETHKQTSGEDSLSTKAVVLSTKASLKLLLRMTQSHLVHRILNFLQGKLGNLLLVSRQSL
ncbi:hypothetical protein MtrunA17_Chr3g0141521 [Medicago truncatula]|uniref:Uncharacterized protein n=1 Tax=Medicago truncatula TaxID=3880 RepID=A0A396J2B8_MEDTR|nr:hypothetical protein MtrunA17_Chr3g0141521 [Medicago truncatula]